LPFQISNELDLTQIESFIKSVTLLPPKNINIVININFSIGHTTTGDNSPIISDIAIKNN